MVILTPLSKIALHLLAMDGDKTPWRASAKVTLTLPFPDAFRDVPEVEESRIARADYKNEDDVIGDDAQQARTSHFSRGRRRRN
jgi:hypothetical protein